MKNSNSQKRPIFIVGTPRSGTTLMAKVLGLHSNLFMPGETHFFEDIYSKKKQNNSMSQDEKISRLLSLYGRYNEPNDQQRVDALVDSKVFPAKLASGVESDKEILDVFMQVQMQMEGKVRWGNNVPRDIFNIDDILNFYPDAKIIVCVRDIRDFLLSYSGKWKITSDEHVQRLKHLYHPVVTSFLWKSSMKLIPGIRKNIPEKNIFIAKYEDLVLEPKQQIKKICAVIEEEFEPQMLDINSANSSAGTEGKGIFTSSIGRWKENLKKEDAYIAQVIAGKELDLLGYPIERIVVNHPLVIWKWVSTPWAFSRALLANKDSRGPILPYLYKRLKAIIS